MTEEELLENFSFLDDWEERYKYILDLGKFLEEFPAEFKNDIYAVSGCVSQVWLKIKVRNNQLFFIADSDSHLVRGLLKVILTLFSSKSKEEILEIDFEDFFQKIGLHEHLTPQRSNGVFSIVKKIREYASNM